MNPFVEFRGWFLWLTDLFINWAMFWYGQIWPLSYLWNVFDAMSDWSTAIATICYDAIMPWNTFISDLANIWYWVNRLAWLDSLRDLIVNAAYVVQNWEYNVRLVINSWWGSASSGIQALINAAIAPLNAVKVAWDNFWTNTLPTLARVVDLAAWGNSLLTQAQSLINAAIATAAPFWAGWADIRTTVLEFFADPLEWLWGKFTDWFLGPEG